MIDVFFVPLRLKQISCNMTDELNRLKVVLVEKKRTGRWLAEQLGKDPATVSKWCTNSVQPDLQTLARISELLEVNIRDLLVANRN